MSTHTPHDISLEELAAAQAEVQRLRRENAALQAELDAAVQPASELRALLHAFPDLHFRLDLDGTILSIEAGPRTDLYLPAEQMLGTRITEFTPPPVARLFADALARL